MSFPTGLRGSLGAAPWSAAINLDGTVWHATSHGEQRHNLVDIGVTPQLRFLLRDYGSYQPFVDVGIGAHVLNGHDFDGLDVGSRFLFGEHVGVGVTFGEGRRWAASVRVQHESNAGFNDENCGLTSVGLRIEYSTP